MFKKFCLFTSFGTVEHLGTWNSSPTDRWIRQPGHGTGLAGNHQIPPLFNPKAFGQLLNDMGVQLAFRMHSDRAQRAPEVVDRSFYRAGGKNGYQ